MSVIVLILLPFCFSEMAKPLHSPLANAERYTNNTERYTTDTERHCTDTKRYCINTKHHTSDTIAILL